MVTEPFLYERRVRAIERLQDEGDIDVSLAVRNASTEEYEAESWNGKNRLERADFSRVLEAFRREKA